MVRASKPGKATSTVSKKKVAAVKAKKPTTVKKKAPKRKKTQKQTGRPTTFTADLGDLICEQLAEGMSLRTVCLPEDMPDKSTVFRWLRHDDKDRSTIFATFRDQYARAKRESADAMAEDLQDIADDAIAAIEKATETRKVSALVQAHKLKADNLKWTMSKLVPKKYGDKLDVTSGDKPLSANPLSDLSAEDLRKLAEAQSGGTTDNATNPT